MKKVILTLLIVYSIQAAYAQDPSQSSRGIWVVESNVSSPKNQVIKFYNFSQELIYEESVTQRKVRYEKERVRKALNKTLEIALNNQEKMSPGTFTMLLKSKKAENLKQTKN